MVSKAHLKQALVFQRRRADALLRLQGLGEDSQELVFLQHGIEIAVSLTASMLGFFCFINENQVSLGPCVWSANAGQDQDLAEWLDLDALIHDHNCGGALQMRTPILLDQDADTIRLLSTSANKPVFNRLLVATVSDGEVVRAILGVADKTNTYHQQDIETVQLIADALWRVVSRQRIQIAHERQNRELAEARARAEDYAQAKSRFLAKMSHEMRTPLNVILNLGQSALELAQDERQRDYLCKTRRAARDLLALVNEILAFSKAESGRLRIHARRFDMCELLSDMLSIITGLATGKALCVYCDTTPTLPRWLVGDRRYLKQVLGALIGNAVKFTSTGEVRLSIRATEADALRPRLLFCIQDSGPGLSDEQVAQLFQPFRQLDDGINRQHGGIGLGLVMARQLIALMGGELRVQSQLGVGSTFFFTLAFQRLDHATLIDPTNLEPLRQARVLVIAPEDSLRTYLVTALQAIDLTAVSVVDSLADAMVLLHQARTVQAPLTLALLDGDLVLDADPKLLADWRTALAPPAPAQPTYLVAIAPRFNVRCPPSLLDAQDVWLEQPLSLCRLMSAMKHHLGQASQGGTPDLPDAHHIEALVVDGDAAQTSLAVLSALGIRANLADQDTDTILQRLCVQPPDLMLIDLVSNDPETLTSLLEHVRSQPHCTSLIIIGVHTDDSSPPLVGDYIDAIIAKPLTVTKLHSHLQPWFRLPPLDQDAAQAATWLEQTSDLDALTLSQHLRQWRNLFDEDITAARKQGQILLDAWNKKTYIHAELRQIQELVECFEIEQAQAHIDALLARYQPGFSAVPDDAMQKHPAA